MDFLYLKSLHIIFVVTWFAGLFYIIRLFIYHVEASGKSEPAKTILQDQYKIMEKRLWYIITWPSAIITAVIAVWMLVLIPSFLDNTWMHVKLLFVLALYAYHIFCHIIFKQLQNNIVKYSSFALRLWNEVATIILFSVVFLVVLKNAISWIWGVVGIVLFAVLLMLLTKLYKIIRDRN